VVERDSREGEVGEEINQKRRNPVIFEYFRPKRKSERERGEVSHKEKKGNC